MPPESLPTHTRRRFLWLYVLILLSSILSNSCAWLIAPPESDAPAQQQVARWADHNKALKQFKGLYRLQVVTREQSLKVRAALAAGAPDHLRVELLNLLGQPLLSLAADGEQMTVLVIADQKFHRFRQSPTALAPFIHVPLGPGELLDSLSGRPALPTYTAVQSGPGPDGATMLYFKDRWHNLVADLRLAADGRMECLHRYNPDGSVQAEIHWIAWHTYNGYLVPRSLKLASGSGEEVTLSVERLWTDVILPPSLFYIEAPGTP